jgi:hypothetical protein
VGADGRRGRPQGATSRLAIEERHAEPSFELGQSLRQRRGTDADDRRGAGPRRRLIDGDEVFELPNRQVRELEHLWSLVQEVFTNADVHQCTLMV